MAGTFGAVRFVDLSEASEHLAMVAASQSAVSVPLALPDPVTIGAATLRQDPTRLDTPGKDADTSLPVELPAPVAAEPAAGPAPSLLEQSSDDTADSYVLLSDEVAADEPAPAAAEALPVAVETQWIDHVVVKGESLAKVFEAHGFSAKLLHQIVTSSDEAKSLSRIRPGQRLRFQVDENRELVKLELQHNPVESTRVAISDDEISLEQVSKAVEKRMASTAGVIESSLFVDGQKAGLADGQIMELATIFGWDIDFALEIRAGDAFRVLYEEHYLDGRKLRDGPLLAAEFTNRGTTYRAVRYEDGNGESGYYDADGQSKRRAFIRTPIKFARVSSKYNPRRWHPVLQKWRSHKGVDYAAPTGTPVKATGDGRVVFRGTKGGYGKTVILEHAGTYTTLYAHLSQYSKRAATGKRVKQGQVIGYVGKTGLASGPHLHYEFRVNGAHRDPLRVKLPTSLSLPKSELAKFHEESAPLLAKLDAIRSDTMVASADTARTP